MLIIFIFILIFFRLFYVQIFSSKNLQAKALEQWSRDLPINAKRGLIKDTNGVTLADSYSTFDVYVRPSMVTDKENVATLLSTTLDIDYDIVFNKVSNKKLSEVLIKMQVKNEVAKVIIMENLAGICLSENCARFYTYGDFATQVLGFTTIDNNGQAGIEAQYNKYLAGTNGYIVNQADVNGVEIDNTLTTYIPSISGCDIQLTIDSVIQLSLENALNKLMLEQKPKIATGIVLNIKTGEILAMSSKPSFDLNSPPRDNVETLLETVRNISVVDVYEPGSTFKVLTMATALDLGVANLNDTFYDPGYVMVDGEKIKCWKHTGHGSQTLTEGLCNSCNKVFVELALKIGKEKMYEYFEKYGLGATLGIDFLGEASGIIMDKESAKNVDVARMGFGQAVAVSPLQLISAISSVLNDGNLMKPYLVKSIKDSSGVTILSNQPTLLRKTISSKTSAEIRVMFEEVVKKFTGIESYIEGYRIGGKTGTTQKYDSATGKISGTYIASFIGAFPADNPEYACLIIADEPSAGSYYGSVVATPYAKLVFKDIIAYKNIAPTEIVTEAVQEISMPNLVGLSLTVAINKLIKLGLTYQIAGDGGVVISQTPPPNSLVNKKNMIILTT